MAQPTQVPPRPVAPFSWSRTFLIFLGLLTLMVLIDPNLSRGMGMATAALLDPLFGFGGRYPVVTIFLAAVLTTSVSTIVRHYFSDWVKMAKTQKQNAALSKAMMEAYRRGNTNKVQRIREQSTKLRQESLGVTTSSLKYMVVTFLMFILVFSWLSNFVNNVAVTQGTVWYAVPWQFSTNMQASYVFAAWLLLYMLFNISLSQVFTRVLKYISFTKKLKSLTSTVGTT